ncbi:MAG: hypothetical protein M1833_006344 [Piccolia ochrophora]|nr:MAG: hypothetical protein M1833_006344 [Piccolia ochrophora]
MTSRIARIICLTGAPDAQALTWEDGHLRVSFTEAFDRYLPSNASRDEPGSRVQSPHSSAPGAVWRALPFEQQPLSTGLSQARYHDGPSMLNPQPQSTDHSQPSFLSVSFTETDEETLSHFYEHSFAIHEDTQSSDNHERESLHDSTSTTTRDSTTTSSQSTSFPSNAQEGPPIPGGHLSDLEDIPNASYLSSIAPQTMTVNLIVGVISIAPARIVHTRLAKQAMQIIEVLVGDETAAGFGITFWLAPKEDEGTISKTPRGADLRPTLNSLRPRDVVMVRNVALSSFRDKVYAQSLRRSVTRLSLLYSADKRRPHRRGAAYRASDLREGKSVHPQVAKVKRVADWVLRFVGDVGLASPSGGDQLRDIPGEGELPPDTQ